MKYKIKNKTETFIKYVDVVFAPQEEKVLELDKAYEHEDFHIEELKEKQKSK